MKPDGTPVPDHRSPFIVGFGGCGIVVAVGDTSNETTNQWLNRRVVFLADPSKDGSYAEYVVCDRRIVTPLPTDGPVKIQSHEAACIPVAGLTALESLQRAGIQIHKGPPPPEGSIGKDKGKTKRLLIVGGAGGVGSWTAQLARAAQPQLEIVGTASSPASAAWCQEMGCDRTIGHDEIGSLGGGREGSCDHIVCLAEPTAELFASLAEVLRPYGTIVLVVAGDAIQNLDLSFVFFKCGTVATQTVFSSIRDGYRLDQAEEMATILDLLRHGRVRAPMSKDWDEERSDWTTASQEGGFIDIVGKGHSRGKLVMKIAKDGTA